MKQKDIKPCAGCGEGVMHNKSMAFYEATIGYRVINVAAVERQIGMEMMMGGNALLANVLGRDEDMVHKFEDDKNMWLCLDCAMTKTVAELWEKINEGDKDEDIHPERD